MKVKVPQKIKILTHTYNIRIDSRFTMGAGAQGITRHIYQEIILDGIQPKSELDQVFLHELIHTIERHFCVKLDDPDVERISEGLAIILFDNLGIELDWSDVEGLDQRDSDQRRVG